MPFRRIASIFVSACAIRRRIPGSSLMARPPRIVLRARSLDLVDLANETVDLGDRAERSEARAEIVTLPALALRRRVGSRRGTRDVVEEDLGEHRAAAHVLDRPHFDPRRIHFDEQASDSVVLALRRLDLVRTRRIIIFDHIAIEVQIFWPLTTYSSPSRSHLHLRLARSDPESGSEYPVHH